MGRIDAETRAQYIAALRRRLAELEHDMYIFNTIIVSNPKNATAGDVEVSRWRQMEAEAIRLAIAELDGDFTLRNIPALLYIVILCMALLGIVFAGWILWRLN